LKEKNAAASGKSSVSHTGTGSYCSKYSFNPTAAATTTTTTTTTNNNNNNNNNIPPPPTIGCLLAHHRKNINFIDVHNSLFETLFIVEKN
jgi:hypothetical protein